MILGILRETIMIAGFVLVMMLSIEYLNVLLKGNPRLWQFHKGWKQYLLAGTLGALPGCLGPWATVTLYSHGLVSAGALVAAMIATSGDESFMMLALIPGQAIWLFLGLLVCGVAAGVVTDLFLKRWGALPNGRCAELTFHPEESTRLFTASQAVSHWAAPSRIRIALTLVLLLLIALIVSGYIGPEEWNWMRVALVIAMMFALFVVMTVPSHFLEEHLWGHVIRKHALRVMGWVFGTLVTTHFIVDVLHIDSLSGPGKWTMLTVACLVGIIPQSGPHLVFLTLYAQGALPLSILAANSIVQDGHGMLPLLAESRRAFLLIKAVNLAVGLLIGAALLSFGF